MLRARATRECDERLWEMSAGRRDAVQRCIPDRGSPVLCSGISEPPMAFAEPNITHTNTRVSLSCPGFDGFGGLRNMDI